MLKIRNLKVGRAIIIFIPVFFIVFIINQMFYGGCTANYCLSAAFPKVIILSSIVTAIFYLSFSEKNNSNNSLQYRKDISYKTKSKKIKNDLDLYSHKDLSEPKEKILVNNSNFDSSESFLVPQHQNYPVRLNIHKVSINSGYQAERELSKLYPRAMNGQIIDVTVATGGIRRYKSNGVNRWSRLELGSKDRIYWTEERKKEHGYL